MLEKGDIRPCLPYSWQEGLAQHRSPKVGFIVRRPNVHECHLKRVKGLSECNSVSRLSRTEFDIPSSTSGNDLLSEPRDEASTAYPNSPRLALKRLYPVIVVSKWFLRSSIELPCTSRQESGALSIAAPKLRKRHAGASVTRLAAVRAVATVQVSTIGRHCIVLSLIRPFRPLAFAPDFACLAGSRLEQSCGSCNPRRELEATSACGRALSAHRSVRFGEYFAAEKAVLT